MVSMRLRVIYVRTRLMPFAPQLLRQRATGASKAKLEKSSEHCHNAAK